jgi:serine/threonine protein kinase
MAAIRPARNGTLCASPAFMDPATSPVAARPTVTFQDGLGERHHVVDRVRNEPLEILCLKSELTAVPSFEFALRERVSHLSAFRHACYARVRSVERLKNPASTLALVSDSTPGVRLSDLLAFAEKSDVTLDIDAALCLLRQIVPAVAMLHENAPEIAHGVISAERIIVTPSARIVVVEHVLGSAIAELKYSAERYWRELRVAVPESAPPVRFDARSDVMQVGVIALSLILGRRLLDEEMPGRLGEVVASSWANSARGGLEPLPASLRAWLMRALQLEPDSRFDSAADAQEELEYVLSESDYLASPSTLEPFLAQYRAAAEAAARARAAAAPAREPSPVTAAQPTAPSPVRVTGAGAYTPAATGAADFARNAPKREEPELVRPADRTMSAPRHTEMSSAPTPVMQAYRPSDRQTDSVDVELTPLAQRVTAAPPSSSSTRAAAPPSSTSIRTAAPQPDAHEAASTWGPKPETARVTETPARPNASSSASKEISFADVNPEPSMETYAEKPATSRRKLPMAAAALALLALAGAGVPAARRFFAPPAAPAEGMLNVSTNPPGAVLFVDGVERGATPVTVSLKPGPHALEVRGNGVPRLMPVTITAGAQVSQYIELPATASTSGELRVRTEPAGARVSVDGVARGVSPVTIPDLPPGEHAVLLESDLGSIKQTVTIEAGNTASLTVPMAAPEGVPVSGWLTIAAPGVVQLFEGGRLIGTSQSERLMVSAGRHDLEIVSEAVGYRVTRTVQVFPGKVTPVKIEFPKGTIALNATPWAEVWVDGEKIGETPIGNYQLTLGSHDVVFRHPELGEQRHTAVVTLNAPARLSVDLRKK